MGYEFKGVCYETLYKFHIQFAQECYKASGSGLSAQFLSCTATPDYVTLQTLTLANGTWSTPVNYNPQQIACTYQPPKVFSNADVVELSWLVVGVWVAAWGIRKLSEMMDKR